MIYSSWNKECDYGTFSALSSTPKKPKNQNLKKNCWRYHHFTQVHQKPQSCKAQFLVYRVRQAKLFVILATFCPFYTLSTQKNQNFKKMKIASGDVIILHICTKNHNHMMYASWDMEWDTQFFVILGHFCPFTPLLFLKLGFTPCKAEQTLRGMELQENEA